MKKNIFLLVIIGLLFYCCEKDNSKESQIVEYDSHESYNFAFADEGYISDILDKFGIDIVKLAKMPSIQDISISTINTLEEGSLSEQSKGEISDYQMSQLQSIYSAMQIAFDSGDESQGFILYDSLCSVCHTIGGFIFHESEYGFELFTYDTSKAPIYIPVDFTEASIIHADAIYNELRASYPSFDNLDKTTQSDILAAAIYYNYNNMSLDKTTNPNDKEECLNEALRMYAVSLSAATATYEASLIACGCTGPGVGACVAVASGCYAVSVGVASWQYHRAVKRC